MIFDSALCGNKPWILTTKRYEDHPRIKLVYDSPLGDSHMQVRLLMEGDGLILLIRLYCLS